MRPPRLYPIAGVIAGLMLAAAERPAGHEIPSDVTVQAFVKPEGRRLRVAVRVPLRAMRDVNFPTQGPGYLVPADVEPLARDAAMLWLGQNIDVFEDASRIQGTELVAVRVSLPSDRSFASYDEAIGHVTGPRLPGTERLTWDAALLDALFEYPIRSDRANFSVRLDFRRLALRVTTALRFVLPDGTIRAFEYTGDPGVIRLDPRWHQAAGRFVTLGFLHILDGADHLLFLLCLVIPFRRVRPLVLIVTSFTVAHSITLMASAAGLTARGLWFPPLVETLIAMSILYMALENIVLGWRGPSHTPLDVRRRWIVAFAFGLVHGFGFSFALGESLQFAGSHLVASLLAFNLGVELGQLAVLAVALPALHLLFRHVAAEPIGGIILSAIIAHTAWHWTADRWKALREFPWSLAEAASLAEVVRWLMVALVLGGLCWRLVAARKRTDAALRDLPQAKT